MMINFDNKKELRSGPYISDASRQIGDANLLTLTGNCHDANGKTIAIPNWIFT